jgi:Bacterial protein of unknown function (DUF937)
MATNLVSLIMQFLTPDMIGRIATALGIDRSIAQTAIGAVVPALLAGFSKTATQPGGAQKLVDAARQQTGTLGNFANTLGTGSQSSLIEKGSQMLSALLGGQDQNSLTQAVAKFAGLSQGPAGSLLGALAPVVMGTIGQQRQQGRSLDASGVTGLLASQKDNIASALPPGFSNLLGGTGLLDALGGAAQSARAAGSEAARVTSSAARTVGDTGRHAAAAAAPARLNWLYWLIPIAAIAAFLIYYFSKPAEQVVQQGVPSIQSLMVGGADIGKQVPDSITSLRTALGSVTDVASAQAALPKIRDATAQIDRVDDLIGQLSAEQRRILSGLVNPVMPTLNQLFDKVLAIPGVADVLKPAIDALRVKLAALTA